MAIEAARTSFMIDAAIATNRPLSMQLREAGLKPGWPLHIAGFLLKADIKELYAQDMARR